MTSITPVEARESASAPSVSSAPAVAQAPGAFYLPQLDVLRFFAFLAVFIGHAFPGGSRVYDNAGVPHTISLGLAAFVRSGAVGVDLFFVLSSYLITTLLLREINARGSVNTWAFYLRRTLRIWPLYFLFIIGYFIIQSWIPKMEGGFWPSRFSGIHLLLFSVFAGNWAILMVPIPPIAHLWSISVEEQFYIAWALVMRWIKVARIPLIAIAMIGIAVLTRLIMSLYHARFVGMWCGTMSRLDPLAMGILIACGALFSKPLRRRVLWIAAAVCLIVAIEWVRPVGKADPLSSVVDYLGNAIACAVILKAMIQFQPVRGVFIRVLAYFGKISYGLYVFHALVLQFLFGWIHGGSLKLYTIRALLAFPATLAVAALSYECYERWFVKLKERFTFVRSRPV